MDLKFSDHVILITRPPDGTKALQRANAFVIRQTMHSPLSESRQALTGKDQKALPSEAHLDLFMVDPVHGARGDPKHNHVESFVKPYFDVRQWTGDPAQLVGYQLPYSALYELEVKKAEMRAAAFELDLVIAEKSHLAEIAEKDEALANLAAKYDASVEAASTTIAALEKTIAGMTQAPSPAPEQPPEQPEG